MSECHQNSAKKRRLLEECEPRRVSSYGSHPWAIVHVPTGRQVQGPREVIDHAQIGRTEIMGALRWSTKREAAAALATLKRQAAASEAP